MKILLLLVAVLPPLFFLRYYYKQDKAKPEPIGLIIKVFAWGCFLVLPAIILELAADYLINPLLWDYYVIYLAAKSFIIAGLIEEWLKRVAVKKVAYNNPHFDEVMDGIVYAVVVSLGFATIENIFYVLDGGLSVGIIRAITALPLHAVAAGIMGYFIGKAKFAETPEIESRLFRKGLLYAIVIHGIYDFIVFYGAEINVYVFLLLPFVLIYGFLKLKKLIKLALEEDEIMGRQFQGELQPIQVDFYYQNK